MITFSDIADLADMDTPIEWDYPVRLVPLPSAHTKLGVAGIKRQDRERLLAHVIRSTWRRHQLFFSLDDVERFCVAAQREVQP